MYLFNVSKISFLPVLHVKMNISNTSKTTFSVFMGALGTLLWGYDANILETTKALLTLSGNALPDSVLLRHINSQEVDDDEGAMAKRIYKAIQSVLLPSIDTCFDEGRIMSLMEALGCTTHVAQNNKTTRLTSRHQATQSASIMRLSETTSECIEWLLIALTDGVLHPIVAAGVFSYYFITTPTTEQCRNELMLLLSILLLRRCGVDWVQYCTPCRAMMKHRGAYYRLTTGHGSVNQWIAYWLDMLCEAGHMLVDEVHSNVPIVVASRISNINMRQRRILDIIEQNQPVKLAQIVMHLHKESINTVKKDLRHLRELGYIGTEGVLKGTVYYKI